MEYRLVSDFKPTGDQPDAIRQLVEGFRSGLNQQTLLGVTGSGKTFTIANVLSQLNKPALVLSHNKTLAAQLYSEFKQFFPENLVEYFVSYYDYYQPEAYLPVTDTYIEKDLSINDEIEKLRLSATSSLMSGRKDVIVVSSVSCLYGIGNPDDFHANVISVKRGDKISRNQFLRKLVDGLYSRNETEFDRGHFRVKGDTVDINLAYADHACRISFWGDEIESIETFDPVNNLRLGIHDELLIYPANIFVTSKERINQAMRMMQDDLVARVEELKRDGKKLEAKRLEERVNYDMEMIKELGYCSGIENYSRYFDGRAPGTRPFCLIDFFPDDFITIIDESHVTIPQIRAMYGGDYSRKRNLVDYGFRLPAALDNRPLRFEEFEELAQRVIYVSATPAEYEIEKSEGIIVEQLIRPTGLPDPRIEVRPSLNQIDDLMEEIRQRCARDERVLVTTLTKRMAEELTDYLTRMGVRCQYIHSDVETLERVKIMEALREGMIDVLVGVNLLREGLDLPEVSLVAILDADKEGFLRSARSLTQTAGRAARNINGLVIMYADTITGSMQETIDATNYRREKQLNYNKQHGITPTPIVKKRGAVIPGQTAAAPSAYVEPESVDVAADPVVALMSPKALEKAIDKAKRNMEAAAKELDFMAAAFYRDEMFRLQELLKEKKAEEKK
ncbi:excinuclease ABC subunit UvrB [Xiashengella succiniciproducens]|jgi:excinuclease ABC subunit B|uniref:UvrABC system protein B n=1 Tax=Xiashengella succiniciproducens TaxID=2949635 RepID=A0A9J6ZTM8_9BACT|nr:excinuclease ABC subunit UvrB [Alkaliflexus sp. Ai-910]MDI9537979.1 excinuclease ABC subunit UvrB [Bacteroidota bacterium]URW80998.1 excinuclease ABC subunit UvrB [Alkaliflexus sp. Ai-910]